MQNVVNAQLLASVVHVNSGIEEYSCDGERLRVDNAHRCLGTQAKVGQIALQEFDLHQWQDSHGFEEMTSAKQGLDPHLVVAESNWPSGIFLRDALANRT